MKSYIEALTAEIAELRKAQTNVSRDAAPTGTLQQPNPTSSEDGSTWSAIVRGCRCRTEGPRTNSRARQQPPMKRSPRLRGASETREQVPEARRIWGTFPFTSEHSVSTAVKKPYYSW